MSKSIRLRKSILFVSIVFFAGACNNISEEPLPDPEPPVEYPELFDLTITYDGQIREYLLYVPEGYTEAVSWPLIINLHGLGSNSLEQMIYSNFNTLADEHKFMIAYPQGLAATFGEVTATHWNANFGTGVDDVGFLSAMLDEIYDNFNFELTQVYAIGMSNGGFMSYTLACELSDRIAAVASVTGSMTEPTISSCDPQRPVPIMEIHGTADEVVPYLGFDELPPTVPDVVEFWVNNNGCDKFDFIEEDLPDLVVSDSSTVTLRHYNLCAQDTEVLFYTINNGGHTWPGALAVPSLGNTNKDINASLLIWEFLNRHSHPDPVLPGS